MPYSQDHKRKTRATIVETARKLFNAHGFHAVSIDAVMKKAGLTRGGFYNHFASKDALFKEAVKSFLMGRGAQWREAAGVDPSALKPEMAQHMLDSYLSDEHLGDIEGQCPMIALPSDVARAHPDVQRSYQELLTAMVWLFENTQTDNGSGCSKTLKPTMDPTPGKTRLRWPLCAWVGWSWRGRCPTPRSLAKSDAPRTRWHPTCRTPEPTAPTTRAPSATSFRASCRPIRRPACTKRIRQQCML